MRKTLNDIDDARQDPLIFAVKQLLNMLGSWLIAIVVLEIAILVLLGIGGFSSLFGSPSGIARFFFWVFAVGFVIEIWLFIAVWRRVKRFLRRTQDSVREKVIDVDAE